MSAIPAGSSGAAAPAAPLSRLTVEELKSWVRVTAARIAERADELTELDAAIGDADHGANMRRGMAAVVKAIDAANGVDGAPALTTIDALLKKTGMTLVSSVGGASGPLYGSFFMRMGASQAGATELGATELSDAFDAGVAGIVARGKARAGEKTMLDAWYPALEALRAQGDDLVAATAAAASAAAEGREATKPMIATKGRASYLGERSQGHIDPGAASTAIILGALADVVAGTAEAPGAEATTPVVQPVPAPAAEEGGGAVGAGTAGAVGIVLVSHSRALAEAARDLATGLMASVSAPIGIAAGLEDGGLGTDAAVVVAAIERLAAQPGNQGVLVIADLGSGIMSAEAALERLGPDTASRARLSPAPFVEGLIGAYGAAGIGLDLEAVAAEAAKAAPAKAAQIS
ncbi:hypothetical protein GCM10011612_14530 [Actinomyces gaoshouyii]|uniref:Dihydroxyacetone kinase subunit L n=1 Tax=Actinomyces gaoshouyii TaxID=1960083 RepID=A0A8H9LF71_9ACTO|nr:hypothetical protein GCM10011612_14530 [Actinomyces gaoshouyii]